MLSVGFGLCVARTAAARGGRQVAGGRLRNGDNLYLERYGIWVKDELIKSTHHATNEGRSGVSSFWLRRRIAPDSER